MYVCMYITEYSFITLVMITFIENDMNRIIYLLSKCMSLFFLPITSQLSYWSTLPDASSFFFLCCGNIVVCKWCLLSCFQFKQRTTTLPCMCKVWEKLVQQLSSWVDACWIMWHDSAVLCHSGLVLFVKAICSSLVFVWEDITAAENCGYLRTSRTDQYMAIDDWKVAHGLCEIGLTITDVWQNGTGKPQKKKQKKAHTFKQNCWKNCLLGKQWLIVTWRCSRMTHNRKVQSDAEVSGSVSQNEGPWISPICFYDVRNYPLWVYSSINS